LVSTGLFVAIPTGYEIQVRPRSGLAAKYGVTVLNSPGTIDADYRGEIKVILINHGRDIFTMKAGDRIGQLVLNKVEQIEWRQVSELDTTERGAGGFGSTGKQ
jgi:dUTP pyrophosphatase